jgi:hypothetical protein
VLFLLRKLRRGLISKAGAFVQQEHSKRVLGGKKLAMWFGLVEAQRSGACNRQQTSVGGGGKH